MQHTPYSAPLPSSLVPRRSIPRPSASPPQPPGRAGLGGEGEEGLATMVDYLLHFPPHLSARMHFLPFAADLLAGRLKLKLTTVASLQQGMGWLGWSGLG